MKLAEEELREYADGKDECLDLIQAYWLYDEITIPEQGTEVFSLMRDSDLPPKEYVDVFFDTGMERMQKAKAEPDGAENSGQSHDHGV